MPARSLNQVLAVDDFRNTCVAHSEKELKDATKAEANLKSWIAGLSRALSPFELMRDDISRRRIRVRAELDTNHLTPWFKLNR